MFLILVFVSASNSRSEPGVLLALVGFLALWIFSGARGNRWWEPHNIAINALIRGDYEQAVAGFRHTIDIDPNWTWGYIKLARSRAEGKRGESRGFPAPG